MNKKEYIINRLYKIYNKDDEIFNIKILDINIEVKNMLTVKIIDNKTFFIENKILILNNHISESIKVKKELNLIYNFFKNKEKIEKELNKIKITQTQRKRVKI